MFVVLLTPEAQATCDDLKVKAVSSLAARKGKRKPKSSPDEGLYKQVHKAINLLRGNPKHPGLHSHEYDSIQNPYDKTEKVFEIYAQNNTPSAYRIFWCYGPGKKELTIIAIAPHP